MSDRIKVFFCEDIGELMVSETWKCVDGHETEVDLGRMTKASYDDESRWDVKGTCHCAMPSKLDTRHGRKIYRRIDTGEELGVKSSVPPGAIYVAGYRSGPDGRALTVVCPDGHHWFIDGRASNCTMKGDDMHRCWVRHGRPEDGTLHVDKNGNTCAAGAGSIDTGKWHGFLHNGELHT